MVGTIATGILVTVELGVTIYTLNKIGAFSSIRKKFTKSKAENNGNKIAWRQSKS